MKIKYLFFAAFFILVGCNSTEEVYLSKYYGKWHNRGVNGEPEYRENLAVIETKDGWGAIDKTGKFVIKPNREFKHVRDFSEGLARVVLVDNKGCGYINHNGEWVIPPQFGGAGDFHEGLAGAKPMDSDKWGFIDKTGKFVIKPTYYDSIPFHKGLAVVAIEKGKWGYINKKGEWVFPPQLNKYPEYHEGLALVGTKDGLGYIDETGKFVIKPNKEFALARDFCEGLAYVLVDDKGYGYIDRKGEWVIPPQFNMADVFHDGLAIVKPLGSDKWGFIDKTGKFVIRPVYYAPSWFYEDLAAVAIEKGKWGYINRKGEWVIPPKFKMAYIFHEGLAGVIIDDGKAGYINKEGLFVIKPIFKVTSPPMPFIDGTARIPLDNKDIYIDKQGNIVNEELSDE